ncbi:zinc finger CCCH domain-containing protein 55-like isoform X1 [Musa acuminata AAA Group]|uniref:zinc finger CCCH domain-containing protein 55-like isoform X1 n=1 Tax=Musa acuminata AAA Group TaxID=214697 RepID=UPI0031DE23CD
MSENVRRRMSKWDVVVEESNFLDENRHDRMPPVKADDLSKERVSKLDLNDGEQLPLWHDMKNDDNVKKDISQHDKVPMRFPELDDKIIRPSRNSSHMDESPKRAFMEQYDSKKSSWEPDSESETVKYAEANRELGEPDSSFVQDYNSGVSPGPDAWRRRSRNVSPRGGWRRSGRSRSRSRSRSRGRGRSRSRSRNRNRSRSRSRSWSRSRSRSRSPFGIKRGSERWSDRGRNIAGGQAPPCRDFASGHCRRGSQCRFLHEDGGRGEFDRHNTHSRETNLERGRFSWHNGKENLSGSWDQTDYARNKPFQRQRSHYDDGDREKPELHRSNKPAELCYDFTKGRCQRGSSCRYLHQEASSHGGWSMKNEAREDNYDRRDPDASFGQKIESRKVNDPPCKYFAEGRCRRGQNCKFSHQGLDGHLEGKPHDGRWDHDQITSDNLSKSVSELGGQTIAVDKITPTRWNSGNDGVRSAAPQFIEMGDFTHPQHQQTHGTEDDGGQTFRLEGCQKPASQEQNITHDVAGPHQHASSVSMQVMAQNADKQQYPDDVEMLCQEGGSVITNNIGAKPEMNSVNSMLTVAPITEKSFTQSGPSQYVVPQLLRTQSFTPNVQIPQVVAPLHFSKQMQQVVYPMPPNGQSQFVVPLTPSDAQHLNHSMLNQPALSLPHAVSNQQNFGEQTQQSAPPSPHNGPSQHKLNLSGPNPQFLLSSVNGQNQHNLNPSGQIQQNVLPFNGQSPRNIALMGQSHQSHVPPQNGQSQENVQLLAPNKQNPVLEPPSDNSFISDNHQTSSQNIPGEGLYSRAGSAETKPSPISSGSVISHKVVTSEQAARITDLSASLAQFFGNGPLHVATLGVPPSQPSLGSSSAVLPAAAFPPSIHPSQAVSDSVGAINPDINNLPGNPRMEESETNSKSLLSVSVTDHIGEQNIDAKQVEPTDGDPSKEVNVTDTGGRGKKEEKAHLGDVDADVADGANKQTKDAKGSKMFKCALVEFVKDLLKPAWKEGQLSREAHKTIVKKVVDKVTSAVQGPNIPQTQEKIDLYLVHSKAKLSKLVQAYVEKYVKN